ncbi:MAG: ribonuclease domain-containing protein [Bulleidia sp.]
MKRLFQILFLSLFTVGCTPRPAAVIERDGVYDQKNDVAEYLYTYHELPSNYMTKAEARELGWEGGALSVIVEGMCIGGDVFGNYEGILPEEDSYYECDIDTLHSTSRGAKRIVYSDDWDIYYTEDHYETFELLYEGGNE